MVGGFNTNVRYRGRTYHIQTEDSGPAIAKIVTLLYEGGSILFSRKLSYSSEAASAQPGAVRNLMEKQHCRMVEALKAGELDAELSGGGRRERASRRDAAGEPPTPTSARAVRPKPAAPAAAPASEAAPGEPMRDAATRPPSAATPAAAPPAAAPPATATAKSAPETDASSATPRGATASRRALDPREFGQGIITPKPLDELILAQLAAK